MSDNERDAFLIFLRQSGDPLKLADWIEAGGSLDERLGLPLAPDARRNTLLRELYGRLGKTYYSALSDYWNRHWNPRHEGCPHNEGSTNGLMWNICKVNKHPTKLLGEKQCDNIVKRNYGN